MYWLPLIKFFFLSFWVTLLKCNPKKITQRYYTTKYCTYYGIRVACISLYFKNWNHKHNICVQDDRSTGSKRHKQAKGLMRSDASQGTRRHCGITSKEGEMLFTWLLLYTLGNTHMSFYHHSTPFTIYSTLASFCQSTPLLLWRISYHHIHSVNYLSYCFTLPQHIQP